MYKEGLVLFYFAMVSSMRLGIFFLPCYIPMPRMFPGSSNHLTNIY